LDRKTKEQVVASLHEQLKEAKLAVLAGYKGMNVAKMTELRNALRKTDSDVQVIKNTLWRIAARGTPFSALEGEVKGPLVMALNASDAVECTKVLVEFAKKNAELELRTGMLEGKVLTVQQIGAISELPSREVLQARLLSVMIGVQTGLVTVLSGVSRGLVQVLAAYRDKKESAS
jgi:large subunit ribosomal protein L10